MAINSLGHITSANSTLILTVEDLYPSGVQLEGFSTDSILTGEDITIAETRMGVDGRLSAGYTPTPKNVTITLETSSPSLEVMVAIYQYMESRKSQPECSMTIDIPDLSQTVSLTQGCLVKARPLPDLKKLLEPTPWGFTFARFKISYY